MHINGFQSMCMSWKQGDKNAQCFSEGEGREGKALFVGSPKCLWDCVWVGEIHIPPLCNPSVLSFLAYCLGHICTNFEVYLYR